MKQKWQRLTAQAERISSKKTKELFDDKRFEQLSISSNGLFIDFSKNKLDRAIINDLVALAKECELSSAIKAMFSGEKLNRTEQRAVMHFLLRAETSDLPEWKEVREQRRKASEFADKVRSGELIGATGKSIDTVVNIGIGGSDLGPKLVIDAFKHQVPKKINIHFMSDVDYDESKALLSQIELDRTLFILCSKSFTTWETQTNARLVIAALKEKVGESGWQQHFAGVSVDHEAMTQFGIIPEHQFLIWDWVGGRYSVWSSIGLVARIALGNQNFDRFLLGANAMDQHFQEAPFEKNLPVLLALVQLWNINFMNHSVFITLPYLHALRLFPDYQQQLEMESNGKLVNMQGERVPYSTSPYIFGQLGLNAQHAFMQLVHQSAHNTYVEFIAARDKSVSFEDDVAFRSCLAQSSALMNGTIGIETGEKHCPGDRPSTTIVLETVTPETLGSLIALYEHKVFVQSVIWGINAFDQFGAELGKQMVQSLTRQSVYDSRIDASTRELIRRFGH